MVQRGYIHPKPHQITSPNNLEAAHNVERYCGDGSNSLARSCKRVQLNLCAPDHGLTISISQNHRRRSFHWIFCQILCLCVCSRETSSPGGTFNNRSFRAVASKVLPAVPPWDSCVGRCCSPCCGSMASPRTSQHRRGSRGLSHTQGPRLTYCDKQPRSH